MDEEYLELLFSFLFVGSLDSLEETKTRILDGGNGCLLVFLKLLVRSLEFLDLRGEQGLGIGELFVTIGDLCGQFVVGQSLDLGNLGLTFLIAQVDIGRGARGLKALGELLQGCKVAATLVFLEGGGVSVLDSRETLDAIAVAERFAGSRAVYITNQSLVVTGVLFHELVPVWLHLLAVASPRCLELDEDRLSGGFGVPIGGGEGDSAGDGGNDKEESSFHADFWSQ
jgi:hypothetical protein